MQALIDSWLKGNHKNLQTLRPPGNWVRHPWPTVLPRPPVKPGANPQLAPRRGAPVPDKSRTGAAAGADHSHRCPPPLSPSPQNPYPEYPRPGRTLSLSSCSPVALWFTPFPLPELWRLSSFWGCWIKASLWGNLCLSPRALLHISTLPPHGGQGATVCIIINSQQH